MSAAREIVKLIAQDPEALRELAEALREAQACQVQKPVLLDLMSAAAYLGLSDDALDRRARQGMIPCIQDGPRCKRFFNRADLDAWRRFEAR